MPVGRALFVARAEKLLVRVGRSADPNFGAEDQDRAWGWKFVLDLGPLMRSELPSHRRGRGIAVLADHVFLPSVQFQVFGPAERARLGWC